MTMVVFQSCRKYNFSQSCSTQYFRNSYSMILDILYIELKHSFFAKLYLPSNSTLSQMPSFQEGFLLCDHILCDHINCGDLDISEWKSLLIKYSHWRIGLRWHSRRWLKHAYITISLKLNQSSLCRDCKSFLGWLLFSAEQERLFTISVIENKKWKPLGYVKPNVEDDSWNSSA